jgi:hypothetical protein
MGLFGSGGALLVSFLHEARASFSGTIGRSSVC